MQHRYCHTTIELTLYILSCRTVYSFLSIAAVPHLLDTIVVPTRFPSGQRVNVPFQRDKIKPSAYRTSSDCGTRLIIYYLYTWTFQSTSPSESLRARTCSSESLVALSNNLIHDVGCEEILKKMQLRRVGVTMQKRVGFELGQPENRFKPSHSYFIDANELARDPHFLVDSLIKG